MARFIIYKDQRSEYRWRFRANNNEIVADSAEGYTSKWDCQRGIELVKQPPIGSEFTIYTDGRGEYRWRLRASNNKIIADSAEGYVSRSDCQRGIDIVKQQAPGADTDDQTGGSGGW